MIQLHHMCAACECNLTVCLKRNYLLIPPSFLCHCVCVRACVCVCVCVGSLVPFSLRLLHAQLPLWTTDPNLPLAVDRVYSLKSTVLKVHQ